MASMDGPTPVGTDGSDFNHRQQVALQYKISARTKSRLKFCIFMHFLLFLVMCAKLLQDVLDRFDIFILEIEELGIPKPDRWEWLWQFSIVFAYSGLTAVRRNRVGSIQFFLFGVFFFSLMPVVYAGVYYFNDFWQYLDSRSTEGLLEWQGYPVALLWYAFITIAFQVHVFELLFGEQLLHAWKIRGNNKKVQ